ncbi:MAG: DMT family transporter [Candidatus Altiarchaeota archaeon]
MDSTEFVKSSRVLNPLESGVRRGKNFLSSLVGALIGLLLFFLVGPGLLFMSEFQYTAENLARAVPASVGSPANGYVYLYGIPSLVLSNPCMLLPEKQCIYYSYTQEELLEKTGVKCGSDANKQGVVKISDASDKCRTRTVRKGGQDVEEQVCEKCINAKWTEWGIVSSKESRPDFKLGVNTVKTPSASFKALKEHSRGEYTEQNRKLREKLSYIDNTDNVLAVGNAVNGLMTTGSPFIVSTKDYESTKEQVKTEQSTNSLIMKVIGFLAILIGMMLILRPITAFVEIAGAIPFLGDIFIGLSSITGMVMFGFSIGIAILLTIVYTLVFKLLRIFVDNIIVAVVIGAIIGLVTLVIASKLLRMRKPPQNKIEDEAQKPMPQTSSSQQLVNQQSQESVSPVKVVNPKMVAYVSKALSEGKSNDEITGKLREIGLSDEEITTALLQAQNP